ncbi:MAG: hypothetical protein ACI8ZX_000951, partial [Planctomycetota bacterium]
MTDIYCIFTVLERLIYRMVAIITGDIVNSKQVT